MEIYLQTQGTRVYRTVLTGWSPPTVQNTDGTAEIKPIETWTEHEMLSSDMNNKALNSIVGYLHESVFTLVTGIKEAKRVWEILETRFEGTSDVKQSKLQMVLSEFEALTMSEEEPISNFHSRVQNLMNRASVLGEPFIDERVVKKILRSQSKRFRMKVTAIQENTCWEKKSVGELMGNLHTYELQVLADDPKILEGFNRRSQGQPNRTQYKSGTSAYQKSELSSFTKTSQSQTGQARKKSMFVSTLSDDEEETIDDPSDENVGNFVAFFTTTEVQSEGDETDSETDDFEERHVQLEMEFAKLVGSWEELVKINKNLNEDLKNRDELLKKLNTELVTKDDLIAQIRSREGKLIKELEDLKKTIKMMDTTSTLDKILDSGRNPNDKKGLGFERGQSSMSAPVFIKEGSYGGGSVLCHERGQSSISTQFYQKGRMSTLITETEPSRVKFQSQHSKVKTKYVKVKQYVSVCHYCLTKGHTRPECYFFYREQRKEKYQNKSITPFTRQVWVRKSEVICYPTIVHTASMTEARWYFNSGCSRHMTGNVKWLMFVQPSSGSVTYGDGQKGNIVGKGILNVPGLPHMDEVLLVSGLKANLISISQLCDQNWNVCFNRDCCRVRDNADQVVMEGTRSFDNCYVLTIDTTCFMYKADESKLWHGRLGHVNFRDMDKVIKLDAVRGIPKLKIEQEGVCGACAIGKQIRAPHKAVKMITTERFLELVHIDLMGPTQTESIRGKKYIFVIYNENDEPIVKIQRLRSDHGKEFENTLYSDFCSENGIAHEFSAPLTAQQNGVVDRKNRTLQEMARVMLQASHLPQRFWAEAVHTACPTVNGVYLRPGTSQTSYEIWKGKKPNLKYFHVFGTKCYVLIDREQRGKFEPKSDEGVFHGY
ncbi:PREDICTED: uncharacterized protein LOC109170883 [Ipomoea nil]|uniref:uncharacterized protein LOC109170883 n=1 Tax=Ipomoea nil TaxID=35883 RepID=UPI0009008AF9|nr:PREDICTED: uncharacterized protein LOC109170883 [Ipomoea nil]